MTTTNYSMCMLFICLFASCGTGEKRTDESIRIKVAEVEMSVPSSEREFSFISKPFKETELSFRVGGPIDRLRKIIYLPALMKKHVRIILLLRLLLRQRQMSYMIRS